MKRIKYSEVNMKFGILTFEQELRYQELIERVIFLGTHSNFWCPEYAYELESIDQEIDALQRFIYNPA